MPETIICEKARVIYCDLKDKVQSSAKEAAEDTSKASRGRS